MTDLRNYYSPISGPFSSNPQVIWNTDIDNLCEDIYNELSEAIEISSNPKEQLIIEPNEYTDIKENSIKLTNSDFQQKMDTAKYTNLIKSNKYPILNNVAMLSKHTPSSTRKTQTSNRTPLVEEINYELVRFKLPFNGVKWSDMFSALGKLRVSYDGVWDGKQKNTICYGKPNHAVIPCQANRGGCGISALYALGIIDFDTFINFLCDGSTLAKESGTRGATLYMLALYNYINGTEWSEVIENKDQPIFSHLFRTTFTVNNNDDTQIDATLKSIVNFFNMRLNNGDATLLRFGDAKIEGRYKQKTDFINEESFGHSIVVYKENDQCYIADFWLASKLTFYKAPNGECTVSSWEKTAGANRVGMISELTVDNLWAQMEIQGHATAAGTIFEAILCNSVGGNDCRLMSKFNIPTTSTEAKFTNIPKTKPKSLKVQESPAPNASKSMVSPPPSSISSRTKSTTRSLPRPSSTSMPTDLVIDDTQITKITKSKDGNFTLCTPTNCVIVGATIAAALAGKYFGAWGKTKRHRKHRKHSRKLKN